MQTKHPKNIYCPELVCSKHGDKGYSTNLQLKISSIPQTCKADLGQPPTPQNLFCCKVGKCGHSDKPAKIAIRATPPGLQRWDLGPIRSSCRDGDSGHSPKLHRQNKRAKHNPRVAKLNSGHSKKKKKKAADSGE